MMTPQKQPSTKLTAPPVQDDIAEVLDEFIGCVGVIALYFERRGIKEGLFTKEEIEADNGTTTK